MKSHHHINRYGKKTWQNPTFFHDKNSQETRNRGKLPQCDKEYSQKPTTNIILNVEKLEAFSQR